jgi:hypothetical protein
MLSPGIIQKLLFLSMTQDSHLSLPTFKGTVIWICPFNCVGSKYFTLLWVSSHYDVIARNHTEVAFSVDDSKIVTYLYLLSKGSIFGSMTDLGNEVEEMRKFFAWKRREVSKILIEDMEGTEGGDERIDQYEFMVGSLLMLNKITTNDVEQIMDKFRELSGEKGYIAMEQAEEEAAKAEEIAQAASKDDDVATEEDENMAMDTIPSSYSKRALL